MAKKVINAFNAGEVSPYVYARQDSELYDKSCLKMENFLPLEYGGVVKRPAAKFIYEQDGKQITYPFIFNIDTTYVLSFSNLKLTIFKDDAELLEITTVFAEAYLEDLKFVQSNDVLFISSGQYPVQVLTRTDNDVFSIEELDFKFPPMNKEIDDLSITSNSASGSATLTASRGYFQTSQIDSFLVLKQRRDTTNTSIDIQSNGGLTDAINVSFCTYEAQVRRVNGKIAGKTVIEKSVDGGKTFKEELVLEDKTVNEATGDLQFYGDSGASYTTGQQGVTFNSTYKEGANTFVRLKHYPPVTGTNKAGLHLKVTEPFVYGLFKILNVASDNSTTATGEWISPIQDVIADYTSKTWSALSNFDRGDKVFFNGELTIDTTFSGTGTTVKTFTNPVDSSVLYDDIIDITYDYINNDLYALSNTNKILKFSWHPTSETLAYETQRTLNYSDMYTGAVTGSDTVADQAHFGIAFLDTDTKSQKLYLLMRTQRSGGNTSGTRSVAQNSKQRITYIDVFGDSETSDITSATTLFTDESKSGVHTYNLHGLGAGDGKFYWKAHYVYRSGGKDGQRIDRVSLSYDGSNHTTTTMHDEYGSTTKSTANGSFHTDDYRLMQTNTSGSETSNDTFVRDQLDTVYLNGYLISLNDHTNKLDWRNTNFGDVGINFSGDGVTTLPDETYTGLALIPRIKTLGQTPLVVGNKYEIVAKGSNTGNSEVNFAHVASSITSSNVGGVFTAKETGMADTTFPHTNETTDFGTVKLHSDSIETAQDVDMIIIVQTREDGANAKFRGIVSDGNPAYYQCMKDITGSSDNKFSNQLLTGLFAERFPDITDVEEGAYSDKNGYPKCIAIHENRLCLAGTTNDPNRIWLSQIDDLNNFILGANDTDALDLKFNSLTQDEIKWLCSARELVIGTTANEWSLGSGSDNLPLTPTQLNLKRRSQYGSSKVQGILVNSAILFLMRQGKKLREWYLQNNQEDYLAQDLAAIAEHITGTGITQIAVQNQPTTTVWLVRNDGVLVGLTYERESKTFAWHRHVFTGTVESVSVLPTSGDEDEVYLSIKRTSGTKRDLVKLDKHNWGSSLITEYNGLDFYVRTTGAVSSQSVTLSAGTFSHLASQSVTAKVNGVQQSGLYTVGSDGSLTINNIKDTNGDNVTNATYSIVVGRVYESTLAPLYLDTEGSMGSKKSIHHATIRFKDTLEAKVGQKETGTFGENSVSVLDEVKFASSTLLNTEDAEVWLANHNEFLQTVYVVSDTPQPCEVLAMVVDVEGV